MVSDKGRWVEVRLVIEEGRLIGLDQARHAPMLGPEGAPLTGGAVDAEDLARDPRDGAWWASYEIAPRVWRHSAPGAAPDREVTRPEWRAERDNTGIEGLAFDASGRLWTLWEFSGARDRDYRLEVLDESGWEERRLPRDQPHGATGAAFGRDGWLYVTHRHFTPMGGFSVRVRRARWGEGPLPERDELLLDLPASSFIDNIEGVAVWRAEGRDWLLLISDDNGFALQRNVFALFEIAG